MDLSKAAIIAKRANKTVYRQGDYAIKLMNDDYYASDVLNEALNLSIVYETGFRVPMLHEVTKIDGKWAIICDYIEGKTLAEMIEGNPGETEKYLERFADIHIQMHSYTSERLRHLTDKMQTKISRSGLDATTRYELHTRLDGMNRHKKLCHGDFTPGNVIITPSDEAYVIDWSHATQGNASADTARTFLRFTLSGNNGHAEKYMNLICQKSDTSRQYVQKWLSIVAASQLVKEKPEERELLLSWVHVVEYV